MARTLVIQAAVGEPRRGIWCVECMLSCAFECDLLWLRSDGVTPIATLVVCPECQEH